MRRLDMCHQAVADVRTALRESYDAADRLCTVFMRAKNDATDQGALDKATRRLYGSFKALEHEIREFNALCVRVVDDGGVIRDGNGTVVLDQLPAPPPGEPGDAA